MIAMGRAAATAAWVATNGPHPSGEAYKITGIILFDFLAVPTLKIK
jgi:hypothetical protein